MMPQHPTLKSVSFQTLVNDYRAMIFQDALADFIVHVNYPGVSLATLRNHACNTLIPFHKVSVFHRIKFTASQISDKLEIVDSVQVHPAQTNTHGQIIPKRFNTVLVSGEEYGIHPNKGKPVQINEDLTDCYSGDQIAQVWVVFKIPDYVINRVFPSGDVTPPKHLAYVKWFTPLPATPDPTNHMYKVSRLFHNGKQHASIIPVEMILCSVHLFPRFGPNTPQDWDSSTILDKCQSFYINPFRSINSYLTFA